MLKRALSAIMVTCAFEVMLSPTLFNDEGKTLRFVYYYIRFLEIYSGFLLKKKKVTRSSEIFGQEKDQDEKGVKRFMCDVHRHMHVHHGF